MSAATLTSAIENFVFRRRGAVALVFAAITAVMAVLVARTRIDASFSKGLPYEHPYIRTYSKYQEQFGGANRVLIALMAKQGDIFTPEFFDTLRAATDEVFFIPGVDRSQVQSLFTPNVRYVEVVEDGFAGGNVIPADFQPTPEGLAKVRENAIKSGKVGQLVANDFTGALISVQLQDVDPTTQKRVDYRTISRELEKRIRDRFTSDKVSVHIIGFAKAIGDVSEGAQGVILFFVVSLLITSVLVYLYSHSVKLTLLPLLCSVVAVIWQLGLLNALGYGIDPMSILVPFLVFAIAVSHAVQMVRAYRAEVFGGEDGLDAARAAFRQLLVPGGVALLTDTFGFITMLVIKIPTIQELAITASLGVGVIILTNLFLLPVLLSYLTLSDAYQLRVAARKVVTDQWWRRVSVIMEPGISISILVVSACLGAYAYQKAKEVRVGDLHTGVPELRQNSRYNRDTRMIVEKFSIGVDTLSVIVETVPNGCVDHDVVSLMDKFEGEMRQLSGVQSVISVATVAKVVNAGWNEGSLKWRIIPRNQQALAQAVSPIETATGLLNADGSVMPIMIFLRDHRAETLQSVTDAVKRFSQAHDSPKARFRLATGNAGVMAATNEAVNSAQFPILLWVFGAVILLCLITFRSLRATICIVAPLALVSWLGYVLMVYLQIGLKTSTLPVVALGVGIGVDYGIYLFAKLQAALRAGDYFEDAMYAAFTQTGSAVVFTGLTLAIGVSTWIASDLKFQADMGILLTFMFLVNMLAAIVVLPALARWLFRHHARGSVEAAKG
ncbi:RND transporter [Opitutaceae bacterium EW11]|nr:RND transporter [Opitutaceae bacterium EW11]